MIETEDWGKLYYAIIRSTPKKNIDVLGIGSTKLICRNSALENTIRKYKKVTENYVHVFEGVDIDGASRLYGGCIYTMVYCEAKVYIYGKRYGFDNMIVTYDPAYKENLVRFAGYKHRIKGDI